MKLESVNKAAENLRGVIRNTPLEKNERLSKLFEAEVLLKREDLQVVRSYKLRGAYNKISKLTKPQRFHGVVCASAGNHAQGVALACALLEIKGVIYMPVTTPKQKITQVELFAKGWCEIRLCGDTFDDAQIAAHEFCRLNKATFVHPFDDKDVIAGQGTVGLEILKDTPSPIDYLLLPIGGGGLAAGVLTVFKKMSPEMQLALDKGRPEEVPVIDKFVDGAAVKKVGENNFEICKDGLDRVIAVPEGKVCSTILELYNNDAMVVEPAGALSIAALDQLKDEVRGCAVVCVVSGGNNDINRTEEIREKALLYEGKKHYFVIEFPQRPGALKEFVSDVLGEKDDITHFQFTKRNNKENGPAVIGVELSANEDLETLKANLNRKKFGFTYLNDDALLFNQLVG
jgi:threonine dehydratase